MIGALKPLGALSRGQKARIRSVGRGGAPEQQELVGRLLAMGFLEGSWIELVHEAPFGGDPIAVRARGALIALRRNEANLIEVELS